MYPIVIIVKNNVAGTETTYIKEMFTMFQSIFYRKKSVIILKKWYSYLQSPQKTRVSIQKEIIVF